MVDPDGNEAHSGADLVNPEDVSQLANWGFGQNNSGHGSIYQRRRVHLSFLMSMILVAGVLSW